MGRALLVIGIVALMAAGGSALAAPLPKEELERQKLEQEVRKLRRENEDADSLLDDVLALAPFVTVLGVVAGIVFPVWKEARERRAQRQQALDQQAAENRRRFEEQFAKAIADLGGDSEAVQVSGAVSLENFLRPEYADFHDQVYRVLCANLTVAHSDIVNRFLVRAFAKAARTYVAAALAEGQMPDVDLARCHANRVDLSDLDLRGADFAFGQFRGANLTGCVLTRARGYEANFEKARFSRSKLEEIRFHKAICPNAHFHEAVMTSAELRGADLQGAEFQRAKLQGAHFDNAKLLGARFDQANLADAYFTDAELDDRVLRSMLNAVTETWRKVDPATRTRLEELDAKRPRPRT